MTAFSLGLLLAAGFVHAGWNYLAKQAGGGTVFVWLFASISDRSEEFMSGRGR